MYHQLVTSVEETSAFPTNIPFELSLSWKVVSSIIHVIAVASTVYRLWQRFRMHRAWWDDYILFFPLVLDIFFGISFCFSIPKEREPDSDEPISYALVVLNSYWFTRFMFIAIVWSTRIVISLSLARLFPKHSRPRFCAMVLVAIMASFLVASVLISATTCHRKTALLLANEYADCIRSIAGIPLEDVFLFTGDIISDTLLVFFPIFWFWNVRLPQKERRLILLAFCGNILTLLSAIAFILFNNLSVTTGDAAQFLVHRGMARIEAAISLFVCNFAVVTTALYRLVRRRRPPTSIPIAMASRAPAHEASLPGDAYPITQFYTESSSGMSPTPLTLTEISSFSSVQNSSAGNSKNDKSTATSTTSFIH